MNESQDLGGQNENEAAMRRWGRRKFQMNQGSNSDGADQEQEKSAGRWTLNIGASSGYDKRTRGQRHRFPSRSQWYQRHDNCEIYLDAVT